jgi:hypothetical protein
MERAAERKALLRGGQAAGGAGRVYRTSTTTERPDSEDDTDADEVRKTIK